MEKPGGISIHCVDVANGRVAAGLRVTLRRLDGGPALASGLVNAKGLLDDPALMGAGVVAGAYEVEFDVGAYYRALFARAAGARASAVLNGVVLAPPEPAFLEVVPYRFHVADVAQHYHLPFKFTPWGFSLFRGGA